MNKAIGNQVLLTSDQVRGWQEELQRWEAKKAEIDARVADLRRKLEAAALLSGHSFPQPEPAAPDEDTDQDQGSMGDALKQILAELGRPARPGELADLLQEKSAKFRESLGKNPAYVYTVIGRLKKRGDIKKLGKRIRLVQKDETPPEGIPEGVSRSTVEG